MPTRRFLGVHYRPEVVVHVPRLFVRLPAWLLAGPRKDKIHTERMVVSGFFWRDRVCVTGLVGLPIQCLEEENHIMTNRSRRSRCRN